VSGPQASLVVTRATLVERASTVPYDGSRACYNASATAHHDVILGEPHVVEIPVILDVYRSVARAEEAEPVELCFQIHHALLNLGVLPRLDRVTRHPIPVATLKFFGFATNVSGPGEPRS
jgi:hypothetical protein